MKKLFFLFFTLVIFNFSNAQKRDSLFVNLNEKGWSIPYKRIPGETIFSIARKFHVPPALMADYNQLNFQQDMNTVLKLQIPIAAYNFSKTNEGETKPLYYKTNPETNLRQIAKTSQVSQKTIQEWNGLYSNEIKNGQVLLVGWILFDATVTTQEIAKSTPIDANKTKILKDTFYKKAAISKANSNLGEVVSISPVSKLQKDTSKNLLSNISKDSLQNIEGERQFLEQNVAEEFAVDEKGTAVFFKRAGKSDNGIFYAFHNLAKKGTIIKIINVGNDKVAYAKVIGPLPKTGIYYNSIIGVSSDARTFLDARDEKAWVEIKYAPNK